MNVLARSALLCLALPTMAVAQRRDRCDLIPRSRGTRSTSLVSHQLPSGERNTFIGGGVFVRCPANDLTLESDSLESYGDEGRLYLIGTVKYNEPRFKLTSDFLNYFQPTQRMLATGNVVATLPSGSTLRGPNAEYFRAMPNTRPVARLHATGRPTITVVEKDTTPNPPPPATVVANVVNMFGDSLVHASGQVVVTRQDVVANADSMHLDTEREITILLKGPSIESRGERPYTLRGQRIELTGSNKKLSRVIAMDFATATSQDMTLASDTIDLRVAEDLLQRAIAWGPKRARASSAQQAISADSIDVLLPGQRLREMHAVRAAAAEGKPDTTRFRTDSLDWMRGDTIIARFDSMPKGDTARTRLRELVAEGQAKSFYHMPPADTSVKRPAINYVIGREITVAFEKQQVKRVTVVDRASGLYAEPKPQPKAAADTTKTRAVTDSTKPPARPAPRPPR